jgi:hypothetical protein
MCRLRRIERVPAFLPCDFGAPPLAAPLPENGAPTEGKGADQTFEGQADAAPLRQAPLQGCSKSSIESIQGRAALPPRAHTTKTKRAVPTPRAGRNGPVSRF